MNSRSNRKVGKQKIDNKSKHRQIAPSHLQKHLSRNSQRLISSSSPNSSPSRYYSVQSSNHDCQHVDITTLHNISSNIKQNALTNGTKLIKIQQKFLHQRKILSQQHHSTSPSSSLAIPTAVSSPPLPLWSIQSSPFNFNPISQHQQQQGRHPPPHHHQHHQHHQHHLSPTLSPTLNSTLPTLSLLPALNHSLISTSRPRSIFSGVRQSKRSFSTTFEHGYGSIGTENSPTQFEHYGHAMNYGDDVELFSNQQYDHHNRHKQKTIVLEPGVDYDDEVYDVAHELFSMTSLTRLMNDTVALPLAPCWPHRIRSDQDTTDGTQQRSNDDDFSGSHQMNSITNSTTPLPKSSSPTRRKKVAQFSEGAMTATIEEFHQQQQVTKQLNQAHDENGQIQVEINISTDFESAIAALNNHIVQASTVNGKNTLYDLGSSPSSSPPPQQQQQQSKPTHKIINKIQLDDTSTMTPNQFQALHQAFPNVSGFVTFLESHSRLTPLIAMQALSLDLMILNPAIPTTAFLKHFAHFLNEHCELLSTPAISSYLLQRSFIRRRFGLANAMSMIMIQTGTVSDLNDLIAFVGEQGAQQDAGEDGAFILDLSEVAQKVGSPLFDDNKTKVLRRRMEQFGESDQAMAHENDFEQHFFPAQLKSLSHTAAIQSNNNAIATPQNTGTAITSSTLSGTTLVNLAGINFFHDHSLQHYTIPLHAIINLFQSPLSTRQLPATYEGFPDTLEDIVQHGYRLCALLMNPALHAANPTLYFHNYPLILSFFLTCQDQPKFQQALTYLEENITEDYRNACFTSFGIDTRPEVVFQNSIPGGGLSGDLHSTLHTMAFQQYDQFTIDSIATGTAKGLKNQAKKTIKRRRQNYHAVAIQATELILSHHFAQRDYTAIFNAISWIEQSTIFPSEKVEGYRNRLYAEADDTSFVSLFTNRLMAVGQTERNKLLLAHQNNEQPLPATPLASTIRDFFNPLFTVLPAHPTLSSLSSTLSQGYGRDSIKRLSQNVIESDSATLLDDTSAFFALPKAYSAFITDLIAQANAGPKDGQIKRGDKTVTGRDTISQVFYHDLNPNLLKFDYKTQQQSIPLPTLLEAREIVKFHQIAHKIQHHAIKIRQKIERTFPEFAQIGHYHPAQYPTLQMNGHSLYLTQELDPQIEQLLLADDPNFPNPELAPYRAQWEYNHYLQQNFKELWVKHVTPPMFRILDQTEMGLLHLYSLCEPIIQSSAVDQIPRTIRKPPSAQLTDVQSNENSDARELQQNGMHVVMDQLQTQHNALKQYAQLSLEMNTVAALQNVKALLATRRTGPKGANPAHGIEITPQTTQPVLLEQSVLSQYPLPPASTTSNTSHSTKLSKLSNIDEIMDRVQQDKLLLLSAEPTSIISLSTNSNLYLIREGLNNIRRRLGLELTQSHQVSNEVAAALAEAFTGIQEIQLQLLTTGLIQTPYDVSVVKNYMTRARMAVPYDPVAAHLRANPDIPTHPLTSGDIEADNSQSNDAKSFIKSKYFKAIKSNNTNKKNAALIDDDDDDALIAAMEEEDKQANGTNNVDDDNVLYVRSSTTQLNLRSGPLTLPSALPTQLESTNLLINTIDPKTKVTSVYDITSPITTAEITEFNSIYERSHFNPEKDTVWQSQIPGLSRITSMFDLTFKLGSLPDRLMYTSIIQKAYQASLPDLAIKTFNRQQLNIIPYATPHTAITTIISLLECGKLTDARQLVPKINVFDAHIPVIITASRLAANFKEFNIPIYFLRSLLEPIGAYINSTDSSLPPPSSLNFLALSRLLHYTLDSLIPAPRSSEAMLCKARYRTVRESLDYQAIPAPIDDTIPFSNYQALPQGPVEMLIEPSHTKSSQSSQSSSSSSTRLPGNSDPMMLVLELGLELQQTYGFFTLLSGRGVDGTRDASSQYPTLRSQRLDILRSKVNSEGTSQRDMSSLVMQLITASQYAFQPQLENYFRSLITKVNPTFDPNLNRRGVINNLPGMLGQARVDQARSGVQIMDRSAVDATQSSPASTNAVAQSLLSGEYGNADQPTTGKKNKKKISSAISTEKTHHKRGRTGVNLDNLDQF